MTSWDRQLVPRSTVTAAEVAHDRIIALVGEALDRLEEAHKIIKATLGDSKSIFPHKIDADYLRASHMEDARLEVSRSFWRHFMSVSGVENIMGPTDRKKLTSMLWDESARKDLPTFTTANVFATLDRLYQDRERIFTESVREVFDRFAPARSRLKANKAWKVGEKAILEGMVNFSYGMQSLTRYGRSEIIRDLDRVFSMLDGKGAPKYPGDSMTAIQSAMQDRRCQAETEYFRFQWFKAGTLHVWFKRTDLLKDFNRLGGEGSNLVGPE